MGDTLTVRLAADGMSPTTMVPIAGPCRGLRGLVSPPDRGGPVPQLHVGRPVVADTSINLTFAPQVHSSLTAAPAVMQARTIGPALAQTLRAEDESSAESDDEALRRRRTLCTAVKLSKVLRPLAVSYTHLTLPTIYSV